MQRRRPFQARLHREPEGLVQWRRLLRSHLDHRRLRRRVHHLRRPTFCRRRRHRLNRLRRLFPKAA